MSRSSARIVPMAVAVPWALAAALTLAPTPAVAQEEVPSTGAGNDEPVVLDEQPPGPQAHPEGEYGGVIPGKDKVTVVSGKPGKRRMPSKPTVMWIGFQSLGAGSARVFLQLSDSADFQQSVKGDELVVRLSGFRLAKSNDTRPLDTKFFGTAVSRVAAKRVGATGRGKTKTPGGVELRIQFKDAKEARSGDARLEKAGDGFHYLYLDFGPPK